MAVEQDSMGTTVNTPEEIWKKLFAQALVLIREIEKYGRSDPFWTFGGGTVLMLRHNHRLSKDIDIFVPDPQSFGFISPRLSDVASELTTDYVESSQFVKLILKEGEIDFVASPNLTAQPFDIWKIMGKQVRVETSAEVIAKKFFHRGDRITGRDIFDYAMVCDREPEALRNFEPFMHRHADALLHTLATREKPLLVQYEQINVLDFKLPYKEAAHLLKTHLNQLTEIDATDEQFDETGNYRPS